MSNVSVKHHKANREDGDGRSSWYSYDTLHVQLINQSLLTKSLNVNTGAEVDHCVHLASLARVTQWITVWSP